MAARDSTGKHRFASHTLPARHVQRETWAMKLTTKSVATLVLPDGKSDAFIWDDDLPGFGVRLRGESRRWIVQYRFGVAQRRESLGDIRRVTLDDARRIARQRFAQVELGVDPAAERAKGRAVTAEVAATLKTIAARYLDSKRAVLRPATYNAAERYFRIHWAPLHNRSIAAITRAEVALRLQGIVKEHGRVAAARARTNLLALLSWAMREGIVESNVALATNNPAAGLPSRERVLDDSEVRAIWKACGDDGFGAIVRLLLLTGQRRNEIADLRWSEIDVDAAEITLPPARTKNKRLHIVPLSGTALAILKALPREAGRDLIFGAGDRGFTTWSHGKRAFDALVGNLPLWTLHDLRRTAATGMADLDVDPHVIEAALNHTSGSKRGVAGVYNRSRYEPQKRIALDRWADHLLAVVEGRESKIVSLRA
jgi:integrase